MTELLKQIKWLPSLSVMWIDVVQIVILTFVLYYLIKSLYKTRAWILVKGLMVIGAVYLVISITEMAVLQSIMNSLFSTLLIAIIIMLQPELQKIVELIGTKQFTDVKSLFGKKVTEISWFADKTIEEIVDAAFHMGKEKTGALIVLERKIPLKEYINSGIEIKGSVSSQLLINIFEKDTPLHDGAVIIKDNRIESATSYLPLSTSNSIDKKFGTRHRAAIGISETTDAIVVIVSEETGAVSICSEGKIQHNISREKMLNQLKTFMNLTYEKTEKTHKSTTPLWVKVLSCTLSVVVWIAVTTMIDPVVDTVISNIPVEVVNDSILDDRSQTYTIKSGETISVRIEGKRSFVQKVTANDFVAKADFHEISITNAIPIRVSLPTYGRKVDIINNNSIMMVEIENMIQTTIPVEVEIVGSPKENHVAMATKTIEPITVNAPQSIVKTLDKAVAKVRVDGYAVSFTKEVDFTIYDKNGDLVDMTRLDLTQGKVVAEIDVYKTKKIPLVINIKEQDELADVYFDIKSFKAEADKISVAIVDEEADINELIIELLPDGTSENISTLAVDLRQHLPSGVILANNQDDKITVDFDLIKYQKKRIATDKEKIKINGVATKLTGEVVEIPSYITVVYNASLLKDGDIIFDNLKASILTNEKNAGRYTTTLLIETEGVKLIDDCEVVYKLSKK